MPLSEVHQHCWVMQLCRLGTSLLCCLQIVCFGDQSAISIDKKGGVQCFSYRADPVLSQVLVASQFTFEFDHRGGQLSWKMQEALFNP
jgi:hypothetical protein